MIELKRKNLNSLSNVVATLLLHKKPYSYLQCMSIFNRYLLLSVVFSLGTQAMYGFIF